MIDRTSTLPINAIDLSREQLSQSQEGISGLDSEKYDFLVDNYNQKHIDTFARMCEMWDDDMDLIVAMLNKLNKFDIEDYFDLKWDWIFTLVDKTWIDEFINESEFEKIKSGLINEEKTTVAEEKSTVAERKTLDEKNELNKLYNSLELTYPKFKDWLNKYLEEFQNTKLKSIVDELSRIHSWESSKDNLAKTINSLADYLSNNPQETTKIFSSLSNDPKAYRAFYSFLESSGDERIISSLASIPKKSSNFKKHSTRLNKVLDKSPYFPSAKDSIKIETSGAMMIAQVDRDKSKVVDTWALPPISYIEGKNWYRVKTDVVSSGLIDLRAQMSSKTMDVEGIVSRLEDEMAKNSDTMGGDNSEGISQKISRLERTVNKTDDDLERFDIESEINDLKSDLVEVQKIEDKMRKLQQTSDMVVDAYEREQERFLSDYTKELETQASAIEVKDRDARDTLDFLDSIWFTNIPYIDYLKLQSMINRNPAYYWFSKPLDINKWFDMWDGNSDRNKASELIAFFNKFSWYEIDVDAFRSWNTQDLNKQIYNSMSDPDNKILVWWRLQLNTVERMISESMKSSVA